MSHSGPLGDIDGFNQLFPGKYTSEKPVNIIGIVKLHLKCDCNYGSIVNGIRHLILHFLLLVHHQDIKHTKNQEVNFLKK